MPLLPSLSFDTPGTFVTENQFGSIPSSLASFNAVYMLGYSSKSGAPVGTPYFIQSSDDFFNVFGASASTNSVKLFFDQRSGCGIYFVNVAVKASYTLAIATVTVGTTYSLTIDGITVSYNAVTGDTASIIFAKLADQVNTKLSYIAYQLGSVLKTNSAASGTGITLTSVAAPSYPTLQDVLSTVNTAFDPEMRQG